MNDDQLERSLQSIGKECFVKYFDEFSDNRLKDHDLIDLLMKNENYKESGCKTRVSQSRRIIKEGRAKDALKVVAGSSRVPDPIRRQAEALYDSY